MENEWPLAALDDVTVTPITYGVVKPGPEDPSGVPFVRGGDIFGGRINLGSLRTITPNVSEQYKRTLLQGGELLVSLVGNPGQVAIAPRSLEGANIARQVGLVRLAEGVDARFVQYYLLSTDGQAALGAQSLGSVQQVINLRDLKTVQVPLPPLPEQRTIADILGCLDDKVDLNQLMNQTLEQMAQSLFKSWFIDFDPVRAKAKGELPSGLDTATAELFPDEFEDSGLGPIPRGWSVGRVADLAQHLRVGLTPAECPEEPFDHYSIPAYDEYERPKRELGSAIRSNKYQISAESVLLAKLNPHFARVWLPWPGSDVRCVCSTEFLDLRAKDPFSREYLYCQFSSEAFRERYATLVTGTSNSHQRVKPGALLEMNAIIPPTEIIDAFTWHVRPLLERVAANKVEGEMLAEIRDTLLPKLLSGELPVADAVESMEAVA